MSFDIQEKSGRLQVWTLEGANLVRAGCACIEHAEAWEGATLIAT